MNLSAIDNQEKFNAIVKDALAKSANYSRWQNAINKAVTQIQLNGEFMTWQADSKSLLIWSQESNAIHAANGVCDCQAFDRGFPCWHRAAARLVRIYMELADAPTPTKTDWRTESKSPYLKTSSNKMPERVGGVRI